MRLLIVTNKNKNKIMIFRSFFINLGFNWWKLLSFLNIILNLNVYADDFFVDEKKYKNVYIDSNVTKISQNNDVTNIFKQNIVEDGITRNPDLNVTPKAFSTPIPVPPKVNNETNDVKASDSHVSIPVPPKVNNETNDVKASDSHVSIPLPPKVNNETNDVKASDSHVSIPVPPKVNNETNDVKASDSHVSIPVPPKLDSDDKSTKSSAKSVVGVKKNNILNEKNKNEIKPLKDYVHTKDSIKDDRDVEEEIIIEEVMFDTELYNRPIYDHKNVILPPTISKKQYGENNRHLPKVFYQNEYTDLLFSAVKSDDIQGIKSLIQSGANINAQEISNGYTPVMYAIKYNKIKALRSLILNGADLQKTNLQGQTALHVAASLDNAQAIEVLLAARIDATIRDKKGNRAAEYMKQSMKNTATIMAANYQDANKALIDFVGLSAYDAVQYALQHGAKVDIKDDIGIDGDTPLIIAIKCQDAKMISLLLNNGARLDVSNKKKQVPMQIAINTNNQEIIGILKTVKINREIESMQ